MSDLLLGSMSTSTKCQYRRVFHLLVSFQHECFPKATIWPATKGTVASFVAYLYSKKLAPTTISTYISTLSSMHKISGLPDPSSSFLVKKMILGMQKQSRSLEKRLPITKDILDRLLHAAKLSATSAYQLALFRALFLIAFHAFLRIGEVVVRSKTADSSEILQLRQLTFTLKSKKLTSLEVDLEKWKRHYGGKGVTLCIEASPEQEFRPVREMSKFLSLRGEKVGPVFLLEGGQPCDKGLFDSFLRRSVLAAGLDVNRYKGHSFRIGAATSAAAAGHSDADIQRLGRWKSRAFQRYVRIPKLNAP